MNIELRINTENIHLELAKDGRTLYPVADQDGIKYIEMGYVGDEARLAQLIRDDLLISSRAKEILDGTEKVALGPATDWNATNTQRNLVYRGLEELSIWVDKVTAERLNNG